MKQQTNFLSLFLLLVLVVALLVYAAATHSFWVDEAFTAATVQNGYEQAVQAEAQVHPPLFPVLIAAWGRLAGYTELNLRLLPVFFSLVTLLLVFGFTASLFDRRTALVATALLGLSPLWITYSHNARYYSLAAALSVTVAWAVVSFQRTTRPARYLWLLLYALSAAALLYTVYNSFGVLLAAGLVWLVLWLQNGRRFIDLALFALASLLVLSAFYLWVPTLRQALGFHLAETPAVPWLKGILLSLGYLGYVFGVSEALSPLNPLAWLAVLMVIGVSIGLLLSRTALRTAWIPLVFLGVSALASVVVNLLVDAPQAVSQSLSNRALFALPGLMIWLAAGISHLPGRLPVAALILLLIPYGAGIYNYAMGQQLLRNHVAVPWREIMERIAENEQPGTVVVCDGGEYTCRYYARRFGFDPLSAGAAAQVGSEAPEVWWIQAHISDVEVGEQSLSALDTVRQEFRLEQHDRYAPQDAGIGWLKERYFGLHNYPYRLDLYHFTNPS